jgi:hypothetical protein
MKGLSPYEFIHTGLVIRLLRHSKGFALQLVIDQAKKLENNLTRAGFIVSAEGLRDLRDFSRKLEAETDKNRILTDDEVSDLSEIMAVVEKMVYAEAQTKRVFVLSEGRYSLDCLLYHPEKMFKDGVFGRLPLIAQHDLEEGFRCLLLSRSTAAAFHILRATEAILRKYYLSKILRGREKVLMWGNMTKGLSAKRGKNVKLLERLEYIKNSYRNPTSHPEAEYSLEEAQDLLGVCIDVINAMGQDFPAEEEVPKHYNT